MNTSLGILLWVAVGTLAGAAATAFLKPRRGTRAPALTTSITVGVVGAFLAGALTRGYFGSQTDERILVNLMVAFLGSAVALGIVALFRSPGAKAL